MAVPGGIQTRFQQRGLRRQRWLVNLFPFFQFPRGPRGIPPPLPVGSFCGVNRKLFTSAKDFSQRESPSFGDSQAFLSQPLQVKLVVHVAAFRTFLSVLFCCPRTNTMTYSTR